MKYKSNNCLQILFRVFIFVQCVRVDRDSSVGIANRFGLDDPGIESRWGEIFRTRTDRSWGPSILHTMGTGYFLEVKQPGRGLDRPHTSSAKVKERVELYPYSPFGPSWPFLGWILPSPLTLPLENSWYCTWKFYVIVTVLSINRCPVSINYKHFRGSHYEQKTESISNRHFRREKQSESAHQQNTEQTLQINDGLRNGKPYHLPLPLSWNLGTLTSWNSLGHSRPVRGLLFTKW
jgi:hypothetical protein